jgi:solute:Na+ symporter, SSS family
MSDRLVWLFVFLAVYASYCVFWGLASGRGSRTGQAFFLADRQIPAWVFAVAATAASFTGWAAIGLPAMLLHDGFPVAPLALGAIVIPLGGVLFLKRQWMLSRRYSYVTPAEMLSDYFGGHVMRPAVLLIALLFALPFLGMQLASAGYLIELLTAGAVPWVVAMWVLTALVFLYVCLGGLRAASYVGVLQGLLFAAAIAAIGIVAWIKLGGITHFVDLLAALGASKVGPYGVSAAGDNAYFATPGVIQFIAGLPLQAPVGGPWTAAMVLSYALGFLGLQLAPAFSVGAFAARDVRGFGPQQVWVAAGAIGALLVFFGVIAGVGALFLGAAPAVAKAGLAAGSVLPGLSGGQQAGLVAVYLGALAERAPWFAGLLAVGVLAAVQATAALYASATGTMFARDVYRHFLNPTASEARQRLFGQIGVGATLFASLLLATYLPGTQVQFGMLALGAGLQLLPAMAGLCWLPGITRQGAVSGLVAGLLAVVFTDQLGVTLTHFIGVQLPWGRWPWTIHSAGWGIVCNVAVCLVVSLLNRRDTGLAHRKAMHEFLAGMGRLPGINVALRPVAWALTLAWFFFAVGPGLVFGTWLFGAPDAGAKAWIFGIPSIWAWQIVWWALGVLLCWLLAYKLEFSTPPRERIEPLTDSIRLQL